MVRRLASLALAAGLAAPCAGLAAPSAGLAAPSAPAQPLFRLSDPRLTEASGVAAGIRSPGVLYAQNDSGDSARFFALDGRSGRVLAVVGVRGAHNVDWEDLAVAPDRRGMPSVWIADIGDNAGTRPEVQLYRVDEPRVTSTGPRTLVAGPADVWRLRYPSGHPDAESLAVSPAGRAYVVTKNFTGSSTVYEVPADPGPGAQLLRPIGKVQFDLTGTSGGPVGALGNLTATGAALSPDGRTLVIRTYTDAWFWPVPSSGVAAALRSRPAHVPLPAQPQGEGIAFVGNRVVVDSEGARSRVWSVPVPHLRRSSSSAASAAPASAAPTSAVRRGRSPTRSASAAGHATRSRSAATRSGPLVGTGVGLALGLGALAWMLGRRRQRRRR